MISRRTAELALVAIDAVLRRSGRNGGAVMSPDLDRALVELHAAAADVSPARQNVTAGRGAREELLSVGEAARRLGVSNRTVERRVANGLLRANRVGRNLQIIWEHEERDHDMAEQATTEETPEALPRYRVTAPYITVKTGAVAGVAGRDGYLVIGLCKDAILPADVPPEAVERHLRGGMIEEIAS